MTRLRLMMASPVTHVLPAGTVMMASLAPTSTTVLEIHVDLQQQAHAAIRDPTRMHAHAAPDTQRLVAPAP